MSEITTSTSAEAEQSPAEAIEETGLDEPTDLVHAVEPFRLARMTAAKSLSARIQTQFNLAPAAADAIAYALEDPAEARRQLQAPNRVRIPGGSLLTITGRISTLSVVPHIVNGRVAGATPYPASIYAGDAPPKFWAERDLTTATNGSAEVILKAKTRQQVVDAYEAASRELLAQNDLTRTIRDNGVYFPITVAAMTIKTSEDGLESVTVLTAAEGSSRTASAHRIVGVTGADILYGSIADYRVARGRLQEIMGKLTLPLDEVTEEELERARAASMPAVIVLGFEPDGASTGAVLPDLLDALDAYIAFLHLDPPKQWSDPAKENKLADGVIDSLLAANELSPAEAEWYAGMVPPTEAAALGLPAAPNERAARILRKLAAPAGTNAGYAVGRGVRRYTLADRAGKNSKAAAAASLALRAFPTARRKAITAILARAWEHRAFWRNDWDATTRTPEELRDAALAESRDELGRATLELAVRGSYHLVTAGALASEEPGSTVETQTGSRRASDKRSPARLLDAIMRSERGIHLLYQAVVSGDRATPPPRVEERGTVTVSAAGMPITVTNAWLRETFRSEQAPPTATPASPVTPTLTPEHQLDTTVDELETDIHTLVERMKAIESIVGSNGGPLVMQVGIDSPRASELRDRLEEAVQKLTRYELVWQMANADVADRDEASDEDEA